MGAAWFYHMTRTPLEATLPVLLGKALGAGWRVAVRGPNVDRLGWLDEKLWLGAEEGFLPHGLAGGLHDARQPVLLTTGRDAANSPDCVVSVDGADVAADEVGALARVMILFDGNDPGAVERARGQWRGLTGAGCAAQYWSQESGRWEMKAESG
ncbi:DNA polymerase III subunit chi [Maritimibacter sp. HL-12]|jgi:DNA polymerase III subunit chi|uniref:DNA polymerase III subunit chi n=1 Tax=Maritimibacter sp. HL-12 TaxID=1162418 RepID=UPI000A0F3549|nr:DNA polymerase III subunit chi [Maritimibacter sp. HL-12]SMH30937.1 DNA polymerase III, chi subunit [Maritimibacter sp. HL-12]